jgi:hypothetical protein
MSEKTPTPIAQPPLKRGRPPGKANFAEGAKRSVSVLKNLGFDPIRELVNRYGEIKREVEYWKDIRSRRVIEIIDEKGRERHYDSDAHMAAEKMLLDIGDKLLRYGYGRVPETINVNDNAPPPLIINLTKEGGPLQHFINDDPNYLEHKDDEEL